MAPPPGTPPEAQSAPADAQSAPAPPLPQSDSGPCPRAAAFPPFAGERAQAASRAKLERAALVQKEEARLKAEVIKLRTQVRQARALNVDFGERARRARGKEEQEKEKLDELTEKEKKCRSSIAAWPGGERRRAHEVEDPEIQKLATQVAMEQQWLVHARVTLREAIEERDRELRLLGPAALLDLPYHDVEPPPRPPSAGYSRPTPTLALTRTLTLARTLAQTHPSPGPGPHPNPDTPGRPPPPATRAGWRSRPRSSARRRWSARARRCSAASMASGAPQTIGRYREVWGDTGRCSAASMRAAHSWQPHPVGTLPEPEPEPEPEP